jgi:hypothetical protein
VNQIRVRSTHMKNLLLTMHKTTKKSPGAPSLAPRVFAAPQRTSLDSGFCSIAPPLQALYRPLLQALQKNNLLVWRNMSHYYC